VRHRPGPGVLGEDHPAQAVSRRGPASQQRLTHHRRGPDAKSPPTKEFAQRQRDKGRSTPEILRILKRAIAREMFKQLTRPHEDLAVHDLRPARQAKNITIQAAASALGLGTSTISRTERGMFITPEIVSRYRDWLATA